MTLPAQLAASVRPVLTGWLADPSVLAPSSAGVDIGSQASRGQRAAPRGRVKREWGQGWEAPGTVSLTSCRLNRSCSSALQVGFMPDFALQGGTPAYLLPLLTFNHLMQARRWGKAGRHTRGRRLLRCTVSSHAAAGSGTHKALHSASCSDSPRAGSRPPVLPSWEWFPLPPPRCSCGGRRGPSPSLLRACTATPCACTPPSWPAWTARPTPPSTAAPCCHPRCLGLRLGRGESVAVRAALRRHAALRKH